MDNASRTANRLPLPEPRLITISIMRGTGSFAQEYPTFSLSYVGYPIPEFEQGPSLEDILSDVQAVAINFSPAAGEAETGIEIIAFTQPKKELLDFADSFFVQGIVPTKPTNDIFRRIQDLGRYVVLVNTDYFVYRALIDDSTGELLEMQLEHRFLN